MKIIINMIPKNDTLLLIVSVVSILIYSNSLYGQSFINTTLLTPNGTNIEAKLLVSGEWTQSEKNTQKQLLLAQFPNVTVLDDPTWTYNCHGFAWNLSEGNPEIRWINAIKDGGSPNLVNYWQDASYMEVCNVNQGTKIHYYSGDHSAIKSSVSGKYDSKWGPNCKVRHNPTEVPTSYNGSNRKYYRRIELKPTSGLPCGTNITYSILNIGASSYSWTSGPGLSGSSSSTSATFTKLNNGNEWVKVTANFSGCSNRSSTRYDVITGIVGGTVSQSGYPTVMMLSTMPLVANNQATVDLSYLPNPSSISVSKLSGTGTWSYNSSLKKLYVTLPGSSSISFSIVGSGNTCGNYSRSVTFYTPSYKLNKPETLVMNVSPNPASDFVRVQMKTDNILFSSGNESDDISDDRLYIYIVDAQGKVVEERVFESVYGIDDIDVRSLPSGIYYLNVLYRGNKYAEKKRFIAIMSV
jgi:hypothetical protein